MKRRRRVCDEIPLSGGGKILDELLPLVPRTEGIRPPSVENFQGRPFDPRLRAHKIQRLSAEYGRTIYSVEIEGDLRSTFYLDGETVVSLIIGTHDIYKG
jgi:hypothetical protein